MDPPREVNKDLSSVTTEQKIEDLYNLIRGIGFCMMTTHCKDTGKLVSRAMSPRHVNIYTYYIYIYIFLPQKISRK